MIVMYSCNMVCFFYSVDRFNEVVVQPYDTVVCYCEHDTGAVRGFSLGSVTRNKSLLGTKFTLIEV